MKIIFATSNPNKLKEVKAVLDESLFEIISLNEIGFNEDIEETGSTLEENALIKSSHIHHRYKQNVFAEDTGLEVETLNNTPGVYTARYAGPEKDMKANMDLLLANLSNKKNRSAQFRTVISLIIDEVSYEFEGILRGKISTNPAGSRGFGYDPVFIPDGYGVTLAEMELSEKNKISHRAIAMEKLMIFLKNYTK